MRPSNCWAFVVARLLFSITCQNRVLASNRLEIADIPSLLSLIDFKVVIEPIYHYVIAIFNALSF